MTSLTSRKDRFAPHTLPPGAPVDGTCGRWFEVSGLKVPVPDPTTGPRGITDGAGGVGEEEDDDVDDTLNTFESGMLDLRSTLPVSVHASLVVVAILFAVLATDILFGDVEIFEETGLTVVAVPEDGDKQGEIIDSGGPN
jgi:hypothetical protein